MDPLDIINHYYGDSPKARRLLLRHGSRVGEKALHLAEALYYSMPDKAFIWEASLLHDIGMIFTNAPELGCFGPHPYICHGVLGREILEKAGLPRHALVCERHLGAGLTPGYIKRQGLPLPIRDMTPVSLEERIICFADKFFSKTEDDKEKPLDVVKSKIAQYGPEQVIWFHKMLDEFKA